MNWMRLRELECLTTPASPRTEISMESWDGFQISMSSAQRITTTDMLPTENTSTAQWTTTWHSTIQRWQTLSFSGKMHRPNLLLESEFKQWALIIDLSMDQQWDQPKALSKHRCTLLHLFSIETSLTDGNALIKLRRLPYSLTLFHFWESLNLSGNKLRDLQEDLKNPIHWALTTHSLQVSNIPPRRH